MLRSVCYTWHARVLGAGVSTACLLQATAGPVNFCWLFPALYAAASACCMCCLCCMCCMCCMSLLYCYRTHQPTHPPLPPLPHHHTAHLHLCQSFKRQLGCSFRCMGYVCIASCGGLTEQQQRWGRACCLAAGHRCCTCTLCCDTAWQQGYQPKLVVRTCNRLYADVLCLKREPQTQRSDSMQLMGQFGACNSCNSKVPPSPRFCGEPLQLSQLYCNLHHGELALCSSAQSP